MIVAVPVAQRVIITRHATGTVVGRVVSGTDLFTVTTSTTDFNLIWHCSCGTLWRPAGTAPPPCAHMKELNDVRLAAAPVRA